MPDTQPASWRTIIYGTSVLSIEGEPAGKVREVLGSDAEDIFHGLRVRLTEGKRDVLVGADDVTGISPDGVQSDLTQAEIEALPPYDEATTYHLASVGWLRKHLGWRQDSRSDEEPG